MSTIKQSVNLDFVLGPDLEQTAATASNGLGAQGVASANANKAGSQPFVHEVSDGAYNLGSVCIIVAAILTFSMAAGYLVLNNLVINQKATYSFFLVRSDMLLELPSNRPLMEFIMFEGLLTVWALLMQYKATMVLSSLASISAYCFLYSDGFVTQDIHEVHFHWILLLLRPMLVLRFGCILAYWMGIH